MKIGGLLKKSLSEVASAEWHWLQKSIRNGCIQLRLQPFCSIIELRTK